MNSRIQKTFRNLGYFKPYPYLFKYLSMNDIFRFIKVNTLFSTVRIIDTPLANSFLYKKNFKPGVREVNLLDINIISKLLPLLRYTIYNTNKKEMN